MISGTVLHDVNANNIQDATDTNYPLATVNLLDANGILTATTTTDSNGNYEFTNLIP